MKSTLKPEWFDKVYQEYYPRLYRYSLRFVDSAKAADVVQGINTDKIIKMSEGCLSTRDRKDAYKEEFIGLVKTAGELRK